MIFKMKNHFLTQNNFIHYVEQQEKQIKIFLLQNLNKIDC